MMIRGTSVGLFIGGIFLWLLCKMIPLLTLMMMDWVALFMMGGAMFILLFCFGISGTGLQYDTIPPGTAVINYIRRDGIIVPLLGKRVFSGESFLDVPKLGIVEDVGKDTVFLWGRKKVRFGLENINYTPDPRYFNLCHELYKLGFDDTDDLYEVMNIRNIDGNKERARKVYYLERMGQIYWNMTHQEPRGAKKLLEIFKKKREKHVAFGPRRKATQKNETRETAASPVQKKEEPVKPIQPPPKMEINKDIHDEIDRRLKGW